MTTTRRPLTPEDLLALKRVSDVQISPDRALIAFVVGDAFKEDTDAPRSQIWVVPGDGAAAHPYTTGPRSDTTPRWSPDGRTLAFLSDRAESGKPQVYLLERGAGEARRLTDLPGDIAELEWSPDGTRLAFLMDDPETEQEQRRKQAKEDVIEYEKDHKWRRVWTVEAASGKARQVTSGDAQVWEFSWAPDGGFALIASSEPYEWSWFVARLARVGPAGGEPQTTYTVPEKQLGCPRVSPDGASVAFLSCIWSDRGVNGGDLLVMPAVGGAARNLTEGYGGSIWWIQWSRGGTAIDYMAYEDGEAAIGRIDVATGVRTTRWKAGVALGESFSSRAIAPDGDVIAAVRSDVLHPDDIWLARPDARDALEWRQLTHLHPQLAEFALGETRVLRWKSVDGLEIQGQLALPIGYRTGERVPLITWIHGGPAALYTQQFSSVAQLFAAAGYAVLMPNPRGSIGWGVPFTEANIGDFGGRDFEDLMAGVDYVISLGIADRDRLGVGGWSYGGFMAAWAVTQTDRFKAAIMGGGISNWRSFHGVTCLSAWDRIAYRADPYEQGGRYDHFSPIYYVNKVRTPTLILHGQNDIFVPTGQGYEFFRALKEHGVSAELVVYPREPHDPEEKAHILDRLRRYVEWFKRYLG